ncbi:MAG: hypothetical protein AAGH60_13810 [Pseudomonadota bacterium]
MAVTTDTKEAVKIEAFPRKAVEAVLRDELMGVAETEADINGFALPKEPSVAAVAPVPMDSLVVVEILCSVEEVLGFQPKDATVQTGGYNSVQSALDHMLPRLERQWRKKHGES